jgi:hypothetical protein
MGQIIEEQSFERDEDYGIDIKITQKCEYNSISEWIIVETDGQQLSLPTFEWRMLYNLINKCLEMKGHKL